MRAKADTNIKLGSWRRGAERPLWTSPEPGMHTGTLSGKVIGHVVAAEGGYIAFSREPATLGWFATLGAAQDAAVASA
ncbi:hypothetical protein [Microbacterium sp. P01]|uniref:hypothetical protein n=1 Tax=unclassified Microbacterium TaxID=2609290 RepID=UPI00366C0093